MDPLGGNDRFDETPHGPGHRSLRLSTARPPQFGELTALRDADRFRFANHLSVWIEVEGGEIIDAGYDGMGLVGSTTAKFGLSVTIPGVGFPVLQADPVIENGQARSPRPQAGGPGLPSLAGSIDLPMSG